MPKSRGRPKRRGGPASRPRPSPSPSLSALALRDAGRIAGAVDSLDAETWASGALGSAWEAAGLLEREPEAALCRDVARRAVARPSPEGLAAVAALRLAQMAGRPDIDEAFEVLSRGRPRPAWIDDPPAEPSDGWRAEDPWGSRMILFIEYADPRPYTLMAAILEAAGSTVESLRLLPAGAAPGWSESRDVPMPVVAAPADDVLANLAMALKRTDRTIPRPDDAGFVALRALAWARCRAYLPTEPPWEEIADEERERLITEYFAESGQADNDSTRYLAGLFLDGLRNQLHHDGSVGMESDRVWLFRTAWLPRKAMLDADDKRELPEALRRWIRFALTRRSVEERWIEPVVAAVDEHLGQFEAAFDDSSTWGPAKALATELERRGVNLADRAAAEDAMRALNAEDLARRLIEDR